MKHKVREIFLTEYGGNAIEIPAHIKASLPGGALLSVTLEYEVESPHPKESDERYLDALDDVHDTCP